MGAFELVDLLFLDIFLIGKQNISLIFLNWNPDLSFFNFFNAFICSYLTVMK